MLYLVKPGDDASLNVGETCSLALQLVFKQAQAIAKHFTGILITANSH